MPIVSAITFNLSLIFNVVNNYWFNFSLVRYLCADFYDETKYANNAAV